MTPIPLSLYVHIPWCIRKCPYCDFNSHKTPDVLPEDAYVQALLDDLARELPAIWGRRLESIFIGGGTPSVFSAESLDTLLSGIRAMLPIRPSMEITMEANPGTFEQEKFKGFREAGINRLSIGIQSFNETHLQQLGRVHNTTEALNAAQIARAAGFDNLNLDLMFGLPDQTLDEALHDLEQAVTIQPEHLSWYQLTLEPNTLFHRYPPPLPTDDLVADIQTAGQDFIKRSCYSQYEVSAYAQAGHECRHNRNYWEFGDYIGIGAGAHGKITDHSTQTIRRYQKYRQPTQYMQQVAAGTPYSNDKTLSHADLVFEFMLNALRLRDGFTPALLTERTFLNPKTLAQGLERASSLGLLRHDEQRIVTTDQGWQYLNEVIQLFLEE